MKKRQNEQNLRWACESEHYAWRKDAAGADTHGTLEISAQQTRTNLVSWYAESWNTKSKEPFFTKPGFEGNTNSLPQFQKTEFSVLGNWKKDFFTDKINQIRTPSTRTDFMH